MLLAYFPKSAASLWQKQLATASSVSLRRNFFFSARSSNESPKTRDKTGWTGADGPEQVPVPESVSSSASSTGYNYDKSTFDSLMAYQVAVSFQPKNREETNIFRRRQQENNPATLSASGEDNLFVSAQSSDGYLALGVADGVGGWSEAGYDSSAISRELCHQLKENFEKSVSKSSVSPQQLLVKAFSDVQSSDKVQIGGTTACIGVLSPDRKLKVANLGDSWCGVFRDHKLVKETKFQTHNFNTPFQLAKIPKQILHQAELEGKRYIIDSPNQCDEYIWDLEKDDVVVFATDGVTDNVIPQDIGIFLKDQFVQNTSLGEISARLVNQVVKVSKNPNYPSAFAQELSRITGQIYMGGKEDDVTVVMVKVL